MHIYGKVLQDRADLFASISLQTEKREREVTVKKSLDLIKRFRRRTQMESRPGYVSCRVWVLRGPGLK